MIAEKCGRCALLKDCGSVDDVISYSIFGYTCSYFSPIIEQYESKGYTVTIYQTNPDEDPDDGYDPFI